MNLFCKGFLEGASAACLVLIALAATLIAMDFHRYIDALLP